MFICNSIIFENITCCILVIVVSLTIEFLDLWLSSTTCVVMFGFSTTSVLPFFGRLGDNLFEDVLRLNRLFGMGFIDGS